MIIYNLRKNKAPRDDLVTNAALKFLSHNLDRSLKNVINDCLKIRSIPPAWKKTIIVSILKPDKGKNLPENYRQLYYPLYLKSTSLSLKLTYKKA